MKVKELIDELKKQDPEMDVAIRAFDNIRWIAKSEICLDLERCGDLDLNHYDEAITDKYKGKEKKYVMISED